MIQLVEVIISRRFVVDSVFFSNKSLLKSDFSRKPWCSCVSFDRSLVVSGACVLRSKVSTLWKGDIDVSMEYGE